ncbi:GNAT family N-acetyltransferase [Catellatospora tritici]|uniref:GNAT family N-acetyltransferase n=1 Tax=Catellatospora tritici TaxID=2851566 RepID=UPI001C2CE796|nr:GNAT family N-acetyltransferase [Catellatospora tritici]MBV1849417.1 GNAT family N-acetyltransferase [Catellatospora tritici]
MGLMLRTADHADVAAVLTFWLLAAEGTDRHDAAPAVTRLIDRDPDALLLAVDGDEIVGSLIAGWDGWRCHLYRFAVHPERRRQGIGKALLDAAERRFVTLGGVRADAMVLDANELALPAWSAAGYRLEPQFSRWTKPLV